MISALLLVFLLQVAIHIINTIGKQTINDVVRLHPAHDRHSQPTDMNDSYGSSTPNFPPRPQSNPPPSAQSVTRSPASTPK